MRLKFHGARSDDKVAWRNAKMGYRTSRLSGMCYLPGAVMWPGSNHSLVFRSRSVTPARASLSPSPLNLKTAVERKSSEFSAAGQSWQRTVKRTSVEIFFKDLGQNPPPAFCQTQLLRSA